jgi:hypothetical protein
MNLCEILLKQNYFIYSDSLYLQKEGYQWDPPHLHSFPKFIQTIKALTISYKF